MKKNRFAYVWCIFAVAFFSGCTGRYRRIDLSEDMTEGDLAYYRGKVRSSYKYVEEYDAFYPFTLSVRDRRVAFDIVEGDRVHFHFDDTLFIAPILGACVDTANFDSTGKNLLYQSKLYVLLGAISISDGHRSAPHRGPEPTIVPTDSINLLWGLFKTRKTIHGRSLTLLWLPLISDRSENGEAIETVVAPDASKS